MSALVQKLLLLNQEVSSLDVSAIVNESKVTVGWDCYFIDKSGRAIAGGTAKDVETAKRIAVAECFERAIFPKLFDDRAVVLNLLLNESPSTSGFAAGFDRRSTAYRSACEAVERWAWSKWIDDGFAMPELEVLPGMTPLARHFLRRFDSHRCFQKTLDVSFDFEFPRKITFSVFLGIKGDGVFPGSRVTVDSDESWEHGVIEAVRNLKNFELGLGAGGDGNSSEGVGRSGDGNGNGESESIIGRRILYFGKNLGVAEKQVYSATRGDWPRPVMRVHREVATGIPELFLYRSLCADFLHWHLGDVSRFVY
jgi:hypothetical protein